MGECVPPFGATVKLLRNQRAPSRCARKVNSVNNDDGFVPVLEVVPHSLAAAVVREGVAREHPAHELREPRGPTPEQQVGVVREEGPGGERRPGGRGAVPCIGHDRPACQPPEDDVVHRASRRFRTKCGRASSRACRGIVGLGLLAGAGGASQEESTESTTSRSTGRVVPGSRGAMGYHPEATGDKGSMQARLERPRLNYATLGLRPGGLARLDGGSSPREHGHAASGRRPERPAHIRVIRRRSRLVGARPRGLRTTSTALQLHRGTPPAERAARRGGLKDVAGRKRTGR